LDVGLSLTFSGLAYLVWALVAWISRDSVQDLFRRISPTDLPRSTEAVKVVFVDAGIAIDLVGLALLAVSLTLVVLSSRQRLSISWAWSTAICQSCVAALGAVLVGWAVQQPYFLRVKPLAEAPARTAWANVSGFSLGATLVVAVVVWSAFLVWLLLDRARWRGRGPTLRDGLRTNVFR
jgi:hypothetical protein